jgi:hypothetical protein
MGKEGALWNAENMCAKNLVELSLHLAVMPCVVVKFGAAWSGGAIVNSSGNCSGGEGLGAKVSCSNTHATKHHKMPQNTFFGRAEEIVLKHK